MSMERLTHEQYAANLRAAHPSYELLSEYRNGRGKVKVRCLEHNLTYEVVARSLTTSGQSLMCCGKVRQDAARKKKSREAFATLADRIKAKGRLELVSADGYKSIRSKVLCRCVACGEKRLVNADNATQGQGIDCSCRLAVQVENGKKAWSIDLIQKAVAAREAAGWSNPHDSVERALKGEVLPGACALYLYESPIKGLSKFGISNDCEKRAKEGGYGQQLVPHRSYPSRVDAVLIEQAYKFGYGLQPPAELSDWCGRTELTDATPSEFEERIDELEKALYELGPEAFASEYTGCRA